MGRGGGGAFNKHENVFFIYRPGGCDYFFVFCCAMVAFFCLQALLAVIDNIWYGEAEGYDGVALAERPGTSFDFLFRPLPPRYPLVPLSVPASCVAFPSYHRCFVFVTFFCALTPSQKIAPLEVYRYTYSCRVGSKITEYNHRKTSKYPQVVGQDARPVYYDNNPPLCPFCHGCEEVA